MENTELSIVDICKIFLEKWWLFAICIIVSTSIAFTYSMFFIEPLYISSSTMYVDPNDNKQFDIRDETAYISYAQQVMSTYIELLRTSSFLRDVAHDIDYKYNEKQINSMVKISAIDKTELFKIVVECDDPEYAYKIAQTYEKLAPQKIIEIKGVNAVKIADPAMYPKSSTGNGALKITLIGFILGGIFAACFTLLMNLLDTRIKEESEIAEKYNLNLLGSIPNFESAIFNKNKYKYKNKYDYSDGEEQNG